MHFDGVCTNAFIVRHGANIVPLGSDPLAFSWHTLQSKGFLPVAPTEDSARGSLGGNASNNSQKRLLPVAPVKEAPQPAHKIARSLLRTPLDFHT